MPIPPFGPRVIEWAFRKPACELGPKVIKLSEKALTEIKRIPTYLHLAEIGGKDRFIAEETEAITKAFSEYGTELCRTDLVQELLRIGTQEGTPLSAKEIINYLEISTNLSEAEQKNILKFLEKCKTTFKKKVFDSGKMTECAIDTTELFSKDRGLEFIRVGVTKCDNPEFLTKLVDITDYERTSYIIKDLEALYKQADGDMSLIQDLLDGFLIREISEISEFLTKNKTSLKGYKRLIEHNEYGESIRSLSRKRNRLLSYFGLDKTKFVGEDGLDKYVIPKGSISDMRRLPGSYGQGKRR